MSSRRDIQQSTNRTQVKKSVVSRIANVMILSFSLSILLTLITWGWKGYDYVSHQMFSQLTYNIRSLSERDPVLVDRLMHIMEATRNPIAKIFSESWLNTEDFKKIYETAFFVDWMQKIKSSLCALKTLMCLTALVFFWKTIGILCSALLFVFASFLGSLDGLVKRYVRTAEGGRESTFVFHRVSQWMLKTSGFLLFIYWVLAFTINPMFVVIALSMLLYAFFRISSSTLKKYL